MQAGELKPGVLAGSVGEGSGQSRTMASEASEEVVERRLLSKETAFLCASIGSIAVKWSNVRCISSCSTSFVSKEAAAIKKDRHAAGRNACRSRSRRT